MQQRPPSSSIAEKIVGTWKLRAVVYEDQDTKERSPVYGAHPIGYQLATPRGRWIAVVTAEGRKVPQNDDERALALRSMIAYTGRYRIEENRVIVKVEAAWQQSWVGTEQTRECRFEGDDVLHLEGPPMPHPNLLGKVVRIIVTWERDDIDD
jgi:Lipocalin-like domain